MYVCMYVCMYLWVPFNKIRHEVSNVLLECIQHPGKVVYNNFVLLDPVHSVAMALRGSS